MASALLRSVALRAVRAAAIVVVAGSGATCSLLLDTTAEQCASDADCGVFTGAKCDVATKTCTVPTVSTTTTGGTGGGGTGGAGGSTGGATTSTTGGGGSGGVEPPKCADPDASPIEINGDITSDFELTCDQVYLLNGPVTVGEGATLTIEKGTTIKAKYVDSADPGNADKFGVLVIQPGSKLIAVGTEDQPIVFTSSRPAGERKAGDWGGLILLGNAPTNHKDANMQPTQGKVEGLVSGGLYGGINDNDSSGTLRYLRLEYGGYQIAPGNEVNGITFGGVGRGTIVDHVQVRQTADDCFEFFGGNVTAKYLACQYPGDDAFDWDNGFVGKLQFLVLQQDPAIADDSNGFEGDNDAVKSQNQPISNPTIYNATLCGQNGDQPKAQYGALVRRSTKGTLANILVMGFETGYDVRDPLTSVSLKNSLFFGNLVNVVAEPEVAGMPDDDDAGFDEVATFQSPASMNSSADPQIAGCFNATSPSFGPAVALTANGAVPPADGFFDVSASHVGAFKDATDVWATTGKWAVWAPN